MRKIYLLFLSFLSGILLSLPWIAQLGGFASFFAFIPLFFLTEIRSDNVSYKNSIGLFFLTFFTWNILSTWWIGYVSLPGVLFIVAANAMLMSLVWWAANKVKSTLGILPGYFSLIIFWISFEFLSHRGILPWPWLTLGNGLANSVCFVQWYEFTGVLGGSLWVLLANILIFEAVSNLKRKHSKKFVPRFVWLFIVVFLPAGLSYYLYSGYSESGDVCKAVILQPNIDPYTEKFSGMSEKAQIQRLVQLAEQSASDSTNIILAPETAFPVICEDSLLVEEEKLVDVEKTIRRYPKADFITGAITKSFDKQSRTLDVTNSRTGELRYKSFNSAILVSDLQKTQISHKMILVAGVEKTPFREYFNFFPDFVINPGGSVGELTPGEEPTLLKMKSGMFVAPVICFESVFGNYVRQQVLSGASYLVVLTNDGWWKRSIGVWQHFSYSRIRAVETRRSVIRSANTGISGGINQRGDVISQSEIGKTCALKCNVNSNSRMTFYVIYGDYIGKYSLLLSFGVAFYAFVYRRIAKT